MDTGLLWYDPGDDVEDAVRRAVRRYRERFGVLPNECHVNAAALTEDREINGVRVVRSARVLAQHYWIGRSEPRMLDLLLFRRI